MNQPLRMQALSIMAPSIQQRGTKQIKKLGGQTKETTEATQSGGKTPQGYLNLHKMLPPVFYEDWGIPGVPFVTFGSYLAHFGGPWCYFGLAPWGRPKPNFSGPPRSPLKVASGAQNWSRKLAKVIEKHPKDIPIFIKNGWQTIATRF
jgi:hypothetical protein